MSARMKTPLALLGCLLATTTQAAPDWRGMTQGCVKLATDAEVAQCLRAGVKAQEAQEQADNDKKTAKEREALDAPVRLLVRNTASSITNFAGRGLGEKGASFGLLRNNGADASQAAVAVFGVMRPVLDGRVQPFVGAAWARDGAATPKKDIRQLTAGTVGPLWQSSGPGHESWTLIHTAQLSRRHDQYANTDGTVARLHFDMAWAPLASGEMLGGLAVLPHVAALWQRRTDAGPENGSWRSTYVGAQLEKPFELGAQRFKATASTRRLFDSSVPDGQDKRRVSHHSLSLDYYFYDPNDKTAASQPSLYITRESGTDFLEYGKALNKTTAGLRFKWN